MCGVCSMHRAIKYCKDVFVSWKERFHVGELGLGWGDNINVDNKAI